MSEVTTRTYHREHPDHRALSEAVGVLRRGGIVVHPTDSTYALSVSIDNSKGIDKLYQIKRKSISRPLSILVPNLPMIAEYANLHDEAYRAIKCLLPGPFTFILEAKKPAPRKVLTKRKEVGIRVPDEPTCQRLLAFLGEPILSTSARDPDGGLLASVGEIEQAFGNAIDLMLNVGLVEPQPSTIISFVNGPMEVVRQGRGDLGMLLGDGC
ncbi:MAG: L-threonylcarbamoyladenylate synthase [Candidatus Alcyoniella australis]|nr:L-threonylcarbamoyladenylate synthase [Candidatus Alcyoniella australis]